VKRVALLAVVLGLVVVPGAGAMNREELKAAQAAVTTYLAPTLERPGERARKRIYDCGPHYCHFWVRGTADCQGVVRVRETPATYIVWFKPLRCG
jgi:hypothetical protein